MQNMLTWWFLFQTSVKSLDVCDVPVRAAKFVSRKNWIVCGSVRNNILLCHHRHAMGFAVRVRSAGQKYGPTCHQRDRADVTDFVTLVPLSSLGQHVGVLALAGYKRRKSALTAGPIS